MTVALITPHQRPNSGGVYAIEQFAQHAAALTDVHLIVAKGEPAAVDGVHVHGPRALAQLALPAADALLIPADMRRAERLFGLAPEHGVPMLLFQGYGTPGDPVVHSNLVLARHAICTGSWLLEEAERASCTASLVRYGLDRQVFSQGPATADRGPIVAMMTHPREWKGTADGLEALRLARREAPEIEVRLFGKLDTGFEQATFLATPNELRDVAALMREAAVLVCPSWEEGFGLPGIEAIVSGAALATTDTKGSRDYAFDGRTALVSPPHDPAALARNIVDLIRDPGLRHTLVEAGRQHVDAIFPDWERAAEAFVVAVDDGVRAVERAGTRAPTSSAHARVRGDADGEDLVEARQLRREARRTKLMLREAEAERNEIEAELGRRLHHAADARRRARELQAELERERDATEQAQTARAAADGRTKRLKAQLVQAQQRIAELEAAALAAARQLEHELAQARQMLEAELVQARQALEAELAPARQALEAELEETRRELHELARAGEQSRRELGQLGTELELAGTQRQRLQAALARARVDAQVAEAERDAFQQQALELSRRVARAGDVGNVGDATGERSLTNGLARLSGLPRASWPPLPAGEREAGRAFMDIYRDVTADLPPAAGVSDPLALPLPADRAGVLAAAATDQDAGVLAVSAGDQDAGAPSVDVIVCVHDALEDTRRCLWALLAKAGRRFRLIVVNDGSDEPTTAFLAALAREHPAITLIHRSDPPHGYTIAANLGLRASSSDYVVLLNSDTVVSYGWLERIVEYGQQHQRVGILGPLSNAASHQSVPERRAGGEWATNPLPSWLNEDGMALILRGAASRTDTRLPFVNGFCYAIKRAVIAAIGYFDEASFPTGYAEENDYSQRARAAGFELAVVDDAYVYHAKSRSYGTKNGKAIARRAYQTFLDKHGRAEIERLVSEMEADSTLTPLRTAVADAISSPAASAAALAENGTAGLSIAFVMPGLAEGGSGGSHSIYQEVCGLRRLGVPARVHLQRTAWDRARRAYDDAAEVFETFEGVEDLLEHTADANVIVATHFKSVRMVAAVRAEREDFLPAYYVQDYEPMFTFADERDNVEAAASYTAIPGALLFAKTHWLCNVVSRRHGVFVAKVDPSIDETLYRTDGPVRGAGPVRVAAMLRPRTPRRQPHATAVVLERLLEELPRAVEVTTFGCRTADLNKITRSAAIRDRHRGLLKREEVAELLRRSDVFLDLSTYQAFGRTALEAMACGATAVVPRLGGVWEFAEHERNVLAIDTTDLDAARAAIVSLVEDRDRLERLQAAAHATGARYSIMRAALSEYLVLRHACESRLGPRARSAQRSLRRSRPAEPEAVRSA